MLEFFYYEFLQRAFLASILCGLTCGIIGVWVVLLNIPFVGVAMSHSAFAGAVIGILVGVEPFFMAMFFCIITSLLIGPIAEKGNFSPSISTGIIFSFVLSIAFLGLGMIKGTKTDALNIMWGNILTITNRNLMFLFIITILTIIFLILFYKEILAVIFNREISMSVGILEKPIFFILVFLCGIIITFNLNIIGGILIFSLITIVPMSAYQLTYNLKFMYLLSCLFGIVSCLTGFFLSYWLDLPSGAMIIIVANIIFLFCIIFSPKRRYENR
ncbi:MAG: metal ABC transporter permease [Endomicrobiia bacterium]